MPTEKKPTEPPRVHDPKALDQIMLIKHEQLIVRIEEAKLPMELFETRRTVSRQTWMFVHGHSRAKGEEGPHVWGLAFDWVLDLEHPHWLTVPADMRPQGTKTSGAAWDTGVELRDGACVVVRPPVLEAWKGYGALLKGLEIDWGGDATHPAWRSGRRGDPLGWDPAHGQLPNWRRFRHATVAG